MGELSPWHLLILAGVFVLLFGAKRLPDGARSLGRSLRIFKTEVKGLNDDETAQAQAQLPPATTAATPPAVTPPAAPTAAPTTAPPVAAPPTTSEADAAQQHEAR
jgi:sec-independent protein translocase protein TatA